MTETASVPGQASTSTAHVVRLLDPGPTGIVVWPDDPGWDQARAAWVANVDQQPAAVALVGSADDVCAVVASAARHGLTVLAQGTGHGAATVSSLAGTVLVRTSALAQVEVDPVRRVARCGAGATWGAVTAAAAVHGLVAQAGSAADVGVAGFLLSGGISWLSRSHGLAVNDVIGLEVVTADGHRQHIDTDHQPELFWALRGGGGAFGIVTAIEFRLHPVATLTAGTLFFPMERAGEVLHAWRRWCARVPDRTTSCGRLLQLPPLPELPPALRGQALAAVEVAHQGPEAELAAIVAPLRELGPLLDSIRAVSPVELAALHMDPPGPTPCRGNGMLLTDLPPSAIDTLVASAGHGSGSPLLSVELRQLGAALATRPSHAGALGHLEADVLIYAVGITPEPTAEAKVDAHIDTVQRALAPWAADLHYANLDEQPTGGRDRFHDRTTLDRLRLIKKQVDPDGTITCGHAVQVEH